MIKLMVFGNNQLLVQILKAKILYIHICISNNIIPFLMFNPLYTFLSPFKHSKALWNVGVFLVSYVFRVEVN
jgi:hypothetical protein